jgi:hypothetical protein
MDRFAVGTSVALVIAYVDYNGNALSPTAVSYTILDETDAVLAGPFSVAGPLSSEADITIPGNYNATPGGRRIEMKMTTDTGDTFVDAVYEVFNQATRLTLLVNSFQTYLQAQLTANGLPNLVSWSGATEDQRIAAMQAAYFRLTQFAYLIRFPEYVDTQNIYLQDMHAHITPQMWPVMTPVLFAPYPVSFRNALAKAQVIEANAILTADPIGDRRKSGLLAESIGESKMMFRGGVRPLDLGVSRDTLLTIRAYLDLRFTLTRAV